MVANDFLIAFQPKRELRPQQLAPVVSFKGKSANDTSTTGTTSSGPSFILPYSISVSKKPRGGNATSRSGFSFIAVDSEWQFDNEYDPFFPNEYDKALKDLRERRDREAEEESAKRRTENLDGDEIELEEDHRHNQDKDKTGGVAIAPPPSLNIDYDDDQPFSNSNVPENGGGGNKSSGFGGRLLGAGRGGGGLGLGAGSGSGATAAAKIMAKYGYKEGTGLGRLGQGMSTALQASDNFIL